MGKAVPEIRAQGAELVAIGNGTPLMARDFVESFDVGFPVYTDPDRAAYRLSGLRRGFGIDFGTVGRGRRAVKSGHRQGAVAGDAWQQGGTLVISPENRLVYRYISRAAGDHGTVEEVIQALKSDS